MTRKKIGKFYIGNIELDVSEEIIVEYLCKRGVSPTFVKLMKNRVHTYIQGAQINVPGDQIYIVEKQEFWPKPIYVREWIPGTYIKVIKKKWM